MRARSASKFSIGVRYYSLLAACVLIYVATVVFFKSDSTTMLRYHVSDVQLRLLSLTVVVPAVVIWFAAFYSIVKLGNYVQKIKDTPDGKGFALLYTGVIVSGVGLPVSSLVSRLLNYMADQNTIDQATATIINTHISLVFSVVGFILLALGARRLVGLVKKTRVSAIQTFGVAVLLCILAAVYAVAMFHNPSREFAVAPATTATYAMPDWLIFTTILIPYLVIWVSGSYATLWLHTYHHHVGGKIYKRTLKLLNTGFFVVVLSSILVQFITAVSTTINGWSLGAVLLLLYVLLFMIAVGYLLIALGAKGLNHLEEVA